MALGLAPWRQLQTVVSHRLKAMRLLEVLMLKPGASSATPSFRTTRAIFRLPSAFMAPATAMFTARTIPAPLLVLPPLALSLASAFADASHYTQHEAGGSDEIFLGGLPVKKAGDNLSLSANADSDLTIHNDTDDTSIFALDDSGNISEIGTVNNVDITSHVDRHKDGGADELDGAQLSGSLGSTDSVLTTDGSTARWSTQIDITNEHYDANGTGSGKVYNSDRLDGEHLADIDWADVAMSTSDVSKSDVGLGNVPNQNIAYETTHAGDAFSATEVNNLQGGKLANGEQPWTNIDLETHASNTGTVEAGNCANVMTTELADGETISFDYASFVSANGTAVDQGCDLILATLDNSGGGTVQTTILSGDGSTIHDEQTGNPLMNYSNTSGSPQTVMVGVDNGHFNSGSGTDQDVHVTIY